MLRRACSVVFCLVVALGLLPSGVSAAAGWSVSPSPTLVKATLVSSSGSTAVLDLENNVSYKPFGNETLAFVLDALGFGGGYSQEVSWGAYSSYVDVSCPPGITDAWAFCSSGGSAIIPDFLRTELNLTAHGSGTRSLQVGVTSGSVAFDLGAAAIGVVLTVLEPSVIPPSERLVAETALKLIPYASGMVDAVKRGDKKGFGTEAKSLVIAALKVMLDHAAEWGLAGAVTATSPGMLEAKLIVQLLKIDESLFNLDTHLLTEDATTTVTVSYDGSAKAGETVVSVVVPSTAGWVDTGLSVKQGDHLVVSAAGSWTPGPPETGTVGPDGSSMAWGDNFLNLTDIGVCTYCAGTAASDWAALVGYIGDIPPPVGSYANSTTWLSEAQQVFRVGSSLSIASTKSGRLWLAMNDDAYSGNTSDNAGQVTATVSVLPGSDGGSLGSTGIFTVEGRHPEWTSTAMTVQAGDRLRFSATGQILWDPTVPEATVGPDGASWTPSQVSNPSEFLLPDDPIASLIGKVGNSVFPIGSDRFITAPASGELSLGMNERWRPGCWDDNSGSWQVTVEDLGP
jgi:hypothetical protein